MTSKEGREEAVRRVSQCILQDRNASYGDPEDNFRNIAELWTTTTGVQHDAVSVSILMVQMKMARIKTNPSHLDSWIDIAGYALCQAGMIIKGITVPSSEPKESTVASPFSAAQIAQMIAKLRQPSPVPASAVGIENIPQTS